MIKRLVCRLMGHDFDAENNMYAIPRINAKDHLLTACMCSRCKQIIFCDLDSSWNPIFDYDFEKYQIITHETYTRLKNHEKLKGDYAALLQECLKLKDLLYVQEKLKIQTSKYRSLDDRSDEYHEL
jgi:hypothetical protein